MATAVMVRPEYLWVSIREAPREGAAPVGTLRCGYEYDINPVGEKDGYFAIDLNGKKAYVRKECLEYVHDNA